MAKLQRELKGLEFSGAPPGVDGSRIQGSSNAKKRVRKEAEAKTEERPSKRVKIDATPREVKLKITLPPSQKVEDSPKKKGKPKANGVVKGPFGLPELKWKTLKPAPSSSLIEEKPRGTASSLRPRLWASSRDELLAALPDMASSKCINGLAWEFYETPILLLDGVNNNVFRIRREDMDAFTLDLVTTRSFVCPVPLETIAQDEPMNVDIPQLVVKAETLIHESSAMQAQSSVGLKKKRRAPKYAFPTPKKAAGVSQKPMLDLVGTHSAALPLESVTQGGPMIVDQPPLVVKAETPSDISPPPHAQGSVDPKQKQINTASNSKEVSKMSQESTQASMHVDFAAMSITQDVTMNVGHPQPVLKVEDPAVVASSHLRLPAILTEQPAQDAPLSIDTTLHRQQKIQRNNRSGPPEIATKAKAPSLRRTCIACRSRKKGCSGVLPCENCLKRGSGASCAYPDPDAQGQQGHSASGPSVRDSVGLKNQRTIKPLPKSMHFDDMYEESASPPSRINFAAPLPMYTSHNIEGLPAMPFHPELQWLDSQSLSAAQPPKGRGRPKKMPDSNLAPGPISQSVSAAIKGVVSAAVSSLPFDGNQSATTVASAQKSVTAYQHSRSTRQQPALQNGNVTSLSTPLPSATTRSMALSGPTTTGDIARGKDTQQSSQSSSMNAVLSSSSSGLNRPKYETVGSVNDLLTMATALFSSSSPSSLNRLKRETVGSTDDHLTMAAASSPSSSLSSLNRPKYETVGSVNDLLAMAEGVFSIKPNIPNHSKANLPTPHTIVDMTSSVSPSGVGYPATDNPPASSVLGGDAQKSMNDRAPLDHVVGNSQLKNWTKYPLRNRQAIEDTGSDLRDTKLLPSGPSVVIADTNDSKNENPTNAISDSIAESAPQALPAVKEQPQGQDVPVDGSIGHDVSPASQPNTLSMDPLISSTHEGPVVVKNPPDCLADYVPSPIPQELKTIVDAYLFGKPLTLILSSRLVYDHWSLLLPSAIGYAMMGYFKILGIQEKRVRLDDSAGAMEGDLSLSGHVEWRLRLRWAPGGEEFIMPEVDPKDLEHPWWNPSADANSPSNETVTASVATVLPMIPIPSKEPEDDFPTAPHYRQARIAHPEYKFRHHHFRELYESVLPTYLLAPFGRQVRDLSFPRGWFCLECGKINFQSALRHRRCNSAACVKRPSLVEPYAMSLFMMRDPQDRLPISLPYNTFPKFVKKQITSYDDGTKTISYALREDMPENHFIKHIFTANHPPLQAHADPLLHEIQLNVELARPVTDNSPFFVYSASCPKDDLNPADSEWPNVPPTVNSAKKLMVDRARWHGGVREPKLSVNRLKMLAWVASGHRKSPHIFRAKKHALTFLALGCDVALTLIPRSMELPSSQDAHVSSPWLNPLDEGRDIEEENPAIVPSEANQQIPETPAKAKASKKGDRPTFVLTLVHGDMAILYGDDFEYSIKRDGTSFLIIASHEDS
ncbi:hypothetical protein GALMADRAFT_222574 [Galerina marginata CBS 339.88]|uniref:Zn(2)-C6 fungal-type domain-containing protein n=1 Tax=Galerina marginata (strain CBS 339.88) TaxID=685588 RepID=A0A067TCY3_GALM3|nr:hypothetical protein GALMADRAFT_222574 [Galerina marginata CBS 339.88]